MMKQAWIIFAIVGLFIASFTTQHFFLIEDEPAERRQVERIVVLAPSTVEIVYLLEQGDRVVGVSEFTRYPADAAAKPKVGGYINLDMEALVLLKPDGVILLEEQAELDKKLRKLGMSTVRVSHMSVEGIINSILAISKFLEVPMRGEEEAASLRKRIAKEQEQAKTLKKKPVVLISIGREGGLGKVNKLVAAGARGYHQELIGLAGGVNGYQGNVAFPSLTREHLLRMNPDVIIDLFPKKEAQNIGEKKLLDDWSSLKELKAVQNENVFVIGSDKHYIPGPRFIETLELLHQLLTKNNE